MDSAHPPSQNTYNGIALEINVLNDCVIEMIDLIHLAVCLGNYNFTAIPSF